MMNFAMVLSLERRSGFLHGVGQDRTSSERAPAGLAVRALHIGGASRKAGLDGNGRPNFDCLQVLPLLFADGAGWELGRELVGLPTTRVRPGELVAPPHVPLLVRVRPAHL